MASYDGGSVFLTVVPSFRGFNEAVEKEARKAAQGYNKSFNDEVSRNPPEVGGPEAAVRRKGERAGGAFATAFRKQVETALAKLPDIEPGVDLSGPMGEIKQLKAQLESLRDREIDVDFDFSAADAIAEARALAAQMDSIARKSVDIGLRTDAGAAAAELLTVDKIADRLDGRNIRMELDVDTDRFRRAFDDLDLEAPKANLNSLVGRMVFMGGVVGTLSPAFVGLGAAGAAAMSAIALGAGAAALGVGTLVIGLNGVGDAVKALGAARLAAPEDARQAADAAAASAESIANAQRQVEGAERGLANARRNAANQAEDAARRVAEAQENVGRVAVQSARTVELAMRRQRDAEQNLADAQQSTLLAQEDLTRARERAREALEDLELATRAASLAEEDAQLALERAQQNFANFQTQRVAGIAEAEKKVRAAKDRLDQLVAEGSPAYEIEVGELGLRNAREQLAALQAEQARLASAGGIDGREVELAVRQAQLRLDEARERSRDAQTEAAKAREAGVDGAEAVLDAERRVAQARRAETDATQAIADASRAVAEAQVEGQRRVAEAHEAVTDAVRAQQRQQEASAFAVTGAVASVEGAYAALASAQQNAVAELSSSQRALQDAMAQLSPAGREFAIFWEGLFAVDPEKGPGPLRQLIWDVQNALLPALQNAMSMFLPFVQPVTAFFVEMAGVMGQLAGEMALAFTGAEWRPFFEMIGDLAPDVLLIMGRAAGDLALAFANLAVAFAPIAVDVINGIADGVRRLADWSKGLDQDEGFQGFLEYVREIGPEVVTFLGALADAAANLTVAMAPFGPLVLEALTSLLNVIAEMDPNLLGAMVIGLSAMVTTFKILGLVALVTGSAMGLWVLVLGAVAGALIYAYTEFEWFGAIVDAVINALDRSLLDILAPAFQVLWAIVQPILWGIGDAFEDLWNVAEPILRGIGDAAEDMWDVVAGIFELLKQGVGLLVGAFDSAASGIGTAFDKVKELVAAPIRWVVDTVFKNGIVKAYDWIAGKIGLDPIGDGGLPSIPSGNGSSGGGSFVPGMADGGIYPGYTPGRDIGYIGVSGGEAIMRPEWTRAIGSDAVYEMNKIARNQGVDGVRRLLGLYARGGVVPFLGHFAGSGIVGGLSDLASSAGNVVGGALDLGREGIEVGGRLLGSITGVFEDFVVGQLRKAAEALVNPLINAIPGGGIAKDLAVGAAKSLASGLFGFAEDKDKASIALGSGAFTPGGGAWPPVNFGGNALNTLAAMAFTESKWGDVVGKIGGWRSQGSVSTSDHPKGKALDIMIDNWQNAIGIAAGNMIAAWFTQNPSSFGTKYVIWRDMINKGRGWQPYSHPSDPSGRDANLAHRNHVHVSLFDSGGRLDPGLTMAMNKSGHRELVLTHDQEGALAATMRSLGSGAGRGGTKIIVQGNAYGGVEHEIARYQNRREWIDSVLA